MTDDSKPIDVATFEGVLLEHHRIACGLHMLPFKERWPSGWPIFTIKMFQAVVVVDGVLDEAHRLAGRTADDAHVMKDIERALDVRPACERITRTKLVEIYSESRIGVRGRCSVCNRKRIGTPIEATNISLPHLCFECMSTASATPFGAS